MRAVRRAAASQPMGCRTSKPFILQYLTKCLWQCALGMADVQTTPTQVGEHVQDVLLVFACLSFAFKCFIIIPEALLLFDCATSSRQPRDEASRVARAAQLARPIAASSISARIDDRRAALRTLSGRFALQQPRAARLANQRRTQCCCCTNTPTSSCSSAIRSTRVV